MIVRFASSAIRGFLSPLFSVSLLVSSRRKKTSGTRVIGKGCIVEMLYYLRHALAVNVESLGLVEVGDFLFCFVILLDLLPH